MARAPNEKAAQAEVMYKSGMKMSEISEKLNVPPGTVRRWKSTYQWDKSGKKESGRSDKQNERSEKQSERSEKAGRGGQPGNSNALKNAVYASKYWKYVREDEKQMIDDMPADEEFMLIESLKLTALREKHHMEILARYRELMEKSPDGMVLKEDIKSVIKEMNSSNVYKKNTVTAQQVKVDAIEQVQIIEAELTRIQKVKIKIIEALAKLRSGRDSDGDKTLVEDWITAVKESSNDE